MLMHNAQNLGTMVHSSFGQGAAIRFDGNRYTVCFMSNGWPAVFQEFDLLSGELLFSKPIPDMDCSWGMCSTQGDDVYFSGTSNGVLYRYSSEGLQEVGINPSNHWVWQLYVRNEQVFGGTYPDSKVFEYDGRTGAFRDYGTVKAGEEYVRGITADERWIYAGIGSTKHVVRIDRATGERTELQLEGISGQQGFVDRLWTVDGYLFVSSDFSQVRVFRCDSLACVGTFPCDNMLSDPNVHYPGRLFFKYGSKLCQWDIVREQWSETGIDTLPVGRAKALEWVNLDDDNNGAYEPALALVTVNAELAVIRLAKSHVTTRTLAVQPQPIQIQSLETGQDGKLYVGGYQRGLGVFDPETDSLEHTFGTFPQIEGMTFLNGKAYFGTYTHAHMFRFDPGQPVDFGLTTGHNPGWIGEIGHSQDRPFAMTSGGGRVYVGTVPDYGLRGGALAIYDPEPGSWEVYPNIVEEQSVLGLAYQDGLLYGGTSVWGGLGASPAKGPARLFVWDVRARTKLEEFVPDIPQLDKPPLMIGELKAGPDGLIWGAVDGTIFAMEAKTGRVVKSKMIAPSEYKYSKWRPIFLRWGPDGNLYTTLARRLIVVQPDTLEHVQLGDEVVGNFVLDGAGRLYFPRGHELWRVPIPRNLFK